MNIPRGFLGSRADLVMDVVLVVILLNPILMFLSFRKVRELKYKLHRDIQRILLLVSLVGVFLFELDIRLSGGERAFLKESSYVDSSFFRDLLIFHISIAVISYLAWIALVVISSNKFNFSLPGSFSINHKFYGKLIFKGMVITALTGATLYILAFVV